MKKMHVKRGDTVKVIAGKDKGKEGKIITAIPASSSGTLIYRKMYRLAETRRSNGNCSAEGDFGQCKL